MSLFTTVTKHDLTLACGRCLVFEVISLCSLFWIDQGLPTTLAFVSTAVLLGLIPFPLALIEFRRARTPKEKRAGLLFALWLTAALLLLCVAFQAIYVKRGGVDGFQDVYDATIQLTKAPAFLLVPLFYSLAFVLISAYRVPEESNPTRAVAKMSMLIGVLLCFGGVVIALAVIFLSWLYSLGDWIGNTLWKLAHRSEAKTLEDRRGVGDLPWGKLWLLAYLDHAGARVAMGQQAPTISDDLRTWIQGLERAGFEALARAALSLARLAAPLHDEHVQSPAGGSLAQALTECVEAPSPETRATARERLAACEPDCWETQVLDACVVAICAEGGWAGTTAVREVQRAAALIDSQQSEAELRGAIQTGLLPWALGDEAPND